MTRANEKANLVGFLGSKPRMLPLAKNRTLVRFRLAAHSVYRNTRGEQVKETQWHSIAAYGSLATAVLLHLDVGSAVALEGNFCDISYTDNYGNKRHYPELQLRGFTVLDARPEFTKHVDFDHADTTA